MIADRRHRRWRDVAIEQHLVVVTAIMSRHEPPGIDHTPATSISPPTNDTPMTDTSMAEAPETKPASTTDNQTAANAGSADQAQQRRQQEHAASEQAPPMAELLPASTFPREHPPREPTLRQPTLRLYDNSPPDRKPPHFSSHPNAPDSLPQTPYSGMSAPSMPRAHTGTSADRIPPIASYPTAPGTASQTPQPGMSQQGVQAAGWLVPPPASPTSKITFEGMFDDFSSTIPSVLFLNSSSSSSERDFFPSLRIEEELRTQEKRKSLASNCNTDYLSLSEITFEWGDSYDDKDWMRLRAILAPTLMVRHSFVQTLSSNERSHATPTDTLATKGGLLPSERTRLVLDAGRRIRARNVQHRLRRRPPRAHAAPHRGLQVGEDLRRRSHRPPPTARGAPTVYGAGSEDGGEQGARARDGEALLQEGGRGMEASGASTDGEME